MKIVDIIEIASEAYPDGQVMLAFKKKRNTGDTLALFVARELKSTYPEGDADVRQLQQAEHAMRVAIRELETVAGAFFDRRRDAEIVAKKERLNRFASKVKGT